MALREFTFRGKKLKELQEMDVKEFAGLLPSREKRSLTRGLTEQQKIFLEKFRKNKKAGKAKPVKTHCRNLIVLPEMVGSIIQVHQGKEFIPVHVIEEMIGHYLGEYALTRKRIQHSAPGVGATRSSAGVKKAKK